MKYNPRKEASVRRPKGWMRSGMACLVACSLSISDVAADQSDNLFAPSDDPELVDEVVGHLRPPELRPPKRVPPELRLNLNTTTSPNPNYPFEAELNACIEADVLQGGVGEPCIWQFPNNARFVASEPGASARIAKANILFRYWDWRKIHATQALYAGYRYKDAEFQRPERRINLVRDMSKANLEWRLAKCLFFDHARSAASSISLESINCHWSTTATFALQLENIRRDPTW
ncbi:MAG: hypothetical protein AAF996_11505 [Pseudomonadota bacterium]